MKKCAIGILAFLITSPAIAENGFSVELLQGFAQHMLEAEDAVSEGDSITFGLRGNYTFSRFFALEAGYSLYGEGENNYKDSYSDNIEETFSASAFESGVKIIIPANYNFSLNGRIGLSIWNAELEVLDSAFPGKKFTDEDNGTGLYMAFGVEFSFTKIKVGAEYSFVYMGTDFIGREIDYSIENISLKVGYIF